MATVHLTADQCRNDELPPVCARCGRPATTRVDRKFAWHPPWVGLFLFLGFLPGIFLMFYLTRRQRVRLPMCPRHLRHWQEPGRFALLGLAVCGAVILFGAFAVRDSGVVATGISLFFGVVIALAIWNGRLIRPERIDTDGLVLTGVAEEFAAAAKQLQDGHETPRAYDEYDDEDRPRRPNRYDVDE